MDDLKLEEKTENLQDYIDEQNEIFKRRFVKIDDCVVKSNIFQLVGDAFNQNMKAWQITPEQRSLAFADFMSKTAIGFISIATETALKLGISIEQEEAEKKKREKELELADEQINKTNHEKQMLAEQIIVVKNQAKSEYLKAFTLELDAEIKKQQIATAKIAALSESQKINVLIKTANDNLNLKQAELLVEYLKILSTDENVKLTDENVHKTILEKIEAVNKSQLSSKEKEVNDILSKLPDLKNMQIKNNTELKDMVINIICSNYRPLIGEKISVSLISNTIIDDKTIEFICDGVKQYGKKVYFSFNTSGDKTIELNVLNANKIIYTSNIMVSVKELSEKNRNQ